MDCNFIKKRLSAILDNELNKSEIVDVDEHLKICKTCNALIKEYADLNRKLLIIEEIEPEKTIIIPDIKKQYIFNLFNFSKLVSVSSLIVFLIVIFISSVFVTPFIYGNNEIKKQTIMSIAKIYAKCVIRPSIGHLSFVNFCNDSCEILGNCCCVKEGNDIKCKGGKLHDKI